jgi:hypothetical protein
VGLAQDLLQVAVHLATYEGPNHTQAALRRAVSTAYYALFHLLIRDAAQRWQGSPAALIGLERSFQHGSMKEVSFQFQKKEEKWKDWHDDEHTVPPALQRVAKAFIDLQTNRHAADYNNHEQWSAIEVQALLETAHAAFDDWLSIRTDPMAGNYLLAMLIGKKRS